jgi:hypothetical protein
MISKSSVDSPVPLDYHPEVDHPEFLNNDDQQLDQSYVGITKCAVKVSRIDIAHTCSVIAKLVQVP